MRVTSSSIVTALLWTAAERSGPNPGIYLAFAGARIRQNRRDGWLFQRPLLAL